VEDRQTDRGDYGELELEPNRDTSKLRDLKICGGPRE
jgi:hypothetical protein